MSTAFAPVQPVPGADPVVVLHSVSRWLPQTCTWLYTQVRHLPEYFESHVACEFVQNLDQFDVPRIHCFDEHRARFFVERGMRRLRLRSHMGSVFQTSRRIRAGILHSHFGNQGWASARQAKAAGLKHVVTYYGLDVNFLPRSDHRWYARYREMFGLVDLVLCEGPFMAQAIRNLGCPADKVRVHHLGVDVSRIPFRPRVPLANEPLRVLISAAFREKKGIPTALEALALMQKDIPLEITIIGDAPADARGQHEKRRILDTLARTGLGGRTRLLGYLPYGTLMAEAERHHLFLSPSQTARDGDTEGGAPVSIIEMAASGMPVVSTRHCDIPEVIVSGTTGFLADEEDAPQLARHMEWLYRHPRQWPEMLAAGRRRIETEFSAAIQGQRLAEIYDRVLAG